MPPNLRFYSTKHISAIAPAIIEKLTLLRLSQYNQGRIEEEMSAADFERLHVLLLELSEKIQKANIIRTSGPVAFRAANKQLTKLLDTQWYTHKVHAVVFGAQLLQYYTIICDHHFEPSANIFDFVQFLQKHQRQFGDTADNLFVTEYALIKSYNELCRFDEVYKTILEGKTQEQGMANQSVQRMGAIINALAPGLTQQSEQNPHHIFYQYLAFVLAYTSAKLTEIRFKLNASPEWEEAPVQWMVSQKAQLTKAETYLHAMDILVQNPEQAKGAEYSLGQDILHHFPEKDIARLKQHITMLIAQQDAIET